MAASTPPRRTLAVVFIIDFSAFIALSALPSSRRPITAFTTVRMNSSAAVLHSAISSDTTPAATRMICMKVRYSFRNRCHSGFGFSSGSAFGPFFASSCAACSALNPAVGSTCRVDSTASADNPYHSVAAAAGRGCALMVIVPCPSPRRHQLILEGIRRRPLRCLCLEQCLDFCQILQLGGVNHRVLRVDVRQRVRENGGHTDPGEPFPIGRDHVPRSPFGAGVRQHFRERDLVVVPERPLLRVVRRQFPVLLREVDALEEPDPLLFLGQVEEQLDELEPVVGEELLPVVDLLVPPGPDVPALGARR